MILIEKRIIEVRFKVRFVFSGGGQIFTYIKSKSDVVKLYEMLRLLEAKDKRFHDLCEQLNNMHEASSIFERVFYGDGIVYGFKGSSVKGFLRGLWDKIVFEMLIKRRFERLSDIDLVDELNLLELSKELDSLIPDGIKSLEKGLRDIKLISNIKSLYLVSISPYSCQGLNLCGRTDYNVVAELSRLNRRIVDVYKDSLEQCGCLRVGNEYHCIPLSYTCISCSLFGSHRFSSLLDFSNFVIKTDEAHLFTFLRKMTENRPRRKMDRSHRKEAEDMPQSPFTFEILGLDKPVEVYGTIRIVCNPIKISMLFGLSYLRFRDIWIPSHIYDQQLKNLHQEFIDSCIDRWSSECIDKLASFYVKLFEFLLRYAKSEGIGIGRRSRVGMGLIVEDPVVEVQR
ncbi:hypothetical protein Igag_0612 [Ignisphaera aggregans DSM 17230]|uniref:CRISPR type III-associated protein domain-containing protein n=1 Tax=Ignisphaera aggregans (strain DSM 17230 / JCM 13409 / AQ1.S1) TaxID=583356 RepID=E0SSH4_IGNAA|nr:hypothetical protein Igag_0612 [Ignisphaera aggregans DSM 17230]